MRLIGLVNQIIERSKMVKVKIIVGLVVVVCALGASTGCALATEEFSGVGNTVESKSGEVAFIVPGGVVICASSSGTGKVASGVEMKVEVKFAECKSKFGAEGGAEASVTSCKLNLTPEGKVTIEGGCKLESLGCVVEISSTENKGLSEVAYNNVKEEKGSLEADAAREVKGITYHAGGTCSLVGIKSGKEGEFDGLSLDPVKGVAILESEGARTFRVSGASINNPVTVTVEAAGEQVFETGATTFIKCSTATFSTTVTNPTPDELIFETISYGGAKACASNIIMETPATMEAVNCRYKLVVIDSRVGPLGGTFYQEDPPGKICKVIGKVGATCTIEFRGRLGIEYTNNATTPKTVKYKKRGANRYAIEPKGCPATVGGIIQGFEGTSKIKAPKDISVE